MRNDVAGLEKLCRSMTTKNWMKSLNWTTVGANSHFFWNFGSSVKVFFWSDWIENGGTIWKVNRITENSETTLEALLTRLAQFAVYGRFFMYFAPLPFFKKLVAADMTAESQREKTFLEILIHQSCGKISWISLKNNNKQHLRWLPWQRGLRPSLREINYYENRFQRNKH